MFHVKHQIIHSAFLKEYLSQADFLFQKNSTFLEKYSEKLLWWNKRINLVSRDVSHETIKEHIRHSLLLGAFMGESKFGRIIDTGTGGGLPGLPLAICFSEKQFVLNDIVEKKILAVKQMAGSLELKNVTTKIGSIEKLDVSEQDVIVTKHAFKLNQLLRFLNGKNWSEIIFLKGEKEVVNELDGIKEPLMIEVLKLDEVLRKEFYEGKAIVKVNRAQS